MVVMSSTVELGGFWGWAEWGFLPRSERVVLYSISHGPSILLLLSCTDYHVSAKMELKCFLLLCFRVSIIAAAQATSRDTFSRDTILDVLAGQSELSRLSALVKSLPVLVQQFNSADNFTFLAPNNDAISSWLATNRSTDYLQAALQYHLLNGTYASASIPSTPVFVPTALTNASYCNITGGQRVKASNNGHLAFGSALNTTSNAVLIVSKYCILETSANLTATDSYWRTL